MGLYMTEKQFDDMFSRLKYNTQVTDRHQQSTADGYRAYA